jgi:hypothetical protein
MKQSQALTPEAQRLMRLAHKFGHQSNCNICNTPKPSVVNGVCLDCASPERNSKRVFLFRRH